MNFTKKTTAIVLAGAVGLTSVAYGIGTQTGDGSSQAAGNRAAAERSFVPPGFNDLASELGVEPRALGNALRDYHEQNRGEMRNALAAALADALGKSTEEVQAALDSLQSERKQRFAARLAEKLGIEADAVAEALEELKDEGPGEPGDFASDLAQKLGLEASDVEAALMELRPFKRDGRHHHPHAMPLRQLAAELDVTRAELRAALREMRASFDPGDRRADLVKFLAERFGLSEAKVDAALPEFAGRGPHHGPGPGPGPGGPGGPPHP